MCAKLARQYRVHLVVANRAPGLGGLFPRLGQPTLLAADGGTVSGPLGVDAEAWGVPSGLGLATVPLL